MNTAVQKIRQALGDSATSPRFIETLPRRGYRFLAPVEVISEKPPTPAARTGLRLIPSRYRRFVWVGAALLIAVSLASTWLFLRGGREIGPAEEVSIAVLPLKNLSDDAEQDYFSEGMTDALISELGSIGDLTVISRTSAMQFKEANGRLPEIASELNVTHLVEGSVLRAGDQVRITTNLVNTAIDQQVWSKSYQRSLEDILSLQSEVAQAIAAEIHLALTPKESARASSSPGANPRAYDAYLKALYRWARLAPEEWDQAIELFNESIRADDTFAPPYAALGEIYAFLGWGNVVPYSEALPKAKEAVQKALALDDNLAEAHAVLGLVKTLEWDWSEAERELQLALELNPNCVKAHLWYGQYLRDTMQLDESLASMQRAERLDPLSLFAKTLVGWPLYNARRYDEAIAQWREVLELDPQYQLAIHNLGLAYVMKGMDEEAIRAFKEASRLGSESWAAARINLAYTQAIVGRTQEAIQTLDTLRRQFNDREGPLPSGIAKVFLGLGNEERTFHYLEKAYEERDPNLATVTSEPCFDPLRYHSRFRALRNKMGLPLSAPDSVTTSES